MMLIIYNVKTNSGRKTGMKVTREQAMENRVRILELAARLFRERGFSGIGVNDLMKEAGLTHGGFYGHFASKEDLMAEACPAVLAQSGRLQAGVRRLVGLWGRAGD